jgi:hypothetical protein
MNTCLMNLYLKICQLDSRHVRLILTILAALGSGGIIMALPIHGEVGS